MLMMSCGSCDVNTVVSTQCLNVILSLVSVTVLVTKKNISRPAETIIKFRDRIV